MFYFPNLFLRARVRDVAPVRLHDGVQRHCLVSDHLLLGPFPEDICKVSVFVTWNLEPDVITFSLRLRKVLFSTLSKEFDV